MSTITRAGISRFARSSAWMRLYRAREGAELAADRLRAQSLRENGARCSGRLDAFVNESRKDPRRPELSGARENRKRVQHGKNVC